MTPKDKEEIVRVRFRTKIWLSFLCRSTQQHAGAFPEEEEATSIGQ
jgi:hypothetical protein